MRWFGVEASGRQRLQVSAVKRVAVADVPRSRDNGRHTVVHMFVGSNARVRWNPQHDRIETSAVRVALQHNGADAGDSRSASAWRAVGKLEFARCDARLAGRTDGLGCWRKPIVKKILDQGNGERGALLH